MERRVSVNAGSIPTVTPDMVRQGWSSAQTPEKGGEYAHRDRGVGAGRDQGPCLYLGPGGQRCGRPALAGGFCVAHSPQGQGPKDRTANPARFWAAAGAIAALLWPYLEFVVREIIRWARSH